jgi:hypothetical protein
MIVALALLTRRDDEHIALIVLAFGRPEFQRVLIASG